jgi:hypothetical protein
LFKYTFTRFRGKQFSFIIIIIISSSGGGGGGGGGGVGGVGGGGGGIKPCCLYSFVVPTDFQSQSYFTTGGLPSVNSSWRQAP